MEASYDEATYELTKSYDMEGDTPVFRLEFRSTISFWRRIAQDGSFSDEDFGMNEITVFLPERHAHRAADEGLQGREPRCSSTISCSPSLVTEGSMGEYSFSMDTPNPVTMDSASIKMSMGEGTFRGLANLRARSLTCMAAWARSGSTSAIPCSWTPCSMPGCSMGEMRIEVPDDALYDADSRVKATLGEVGTGCSVASVSRTPNSPGGSAWMRPSSWAKSASSRSGCVHPRGYPTSNPRPQRTRWNPPCRRHSLTAGTNSRIRRASVRASAELELPPFAERLAAREPLAPRSRLETLQLNVGRRCNQVCEHCHVDAGPDRNRSDVATQSSRHASRCSRPASSLHSTSRAVHPNCTLASRSSSSGVPDGRAGHPSLQPHRDPTARLFAICRS